MKTIGRVVTSLVAILFVAVVTLVILQMSNVYQNTGLILGLLIGLFVVCFIYICFVDRKTKKEALQNHKK